MKKIIVLHILSLEHNDITIKCLAFSKTYRILSLTLLTENTE